MDRGTQNIGAIEPLSDGPIRGRMRHSTFEEERLGMFECDLPKRIGWRECRDIVADSVAVYQIVDILSEYRTLLDSVRCKIGRASCRERV